MPLELYMLGLVVHDMPTALEFYRRLGLAIPDGSEKQSHVEIKMGNGFTFFLDSNPALGSWLCYTIGSIAKRSRRSVSRYP